MSVKTSAALHILNAFLAITFLLTGNPALAGEADIVDVRAQKSDTGWSFDVTVRHDDKGWDHYADKWDIVAPDGTVLGSRVLAHPHEDEQPFTRFLSGVKIPETVQEVTIRAHDSVHGYGGVETSISLPR